MDPGSQRCDWRGRADCPRPAELALVYPEGHVARGDGHRRLCHLHARVVLDYCIRAGVEAPVPEPLAGKAVMAGRRVTL
ncbi:MAG: hypothetical protein WCB85_06275 [Candidatus Dormiibacterota bacterium]